MRPLSLFVNKAASPSAEERRRPPFFTFARKCLLTLLGLGVISAILGQTLQGTHSAFTATSVNSGNSFAAGTLLMTNSLSGGCSKVTASNCGQLFNITAAMVPGTPASTTATITNSGTLPAAMSLQVTNVVDVAGGGLPPYVNLTIHDDTSNSCIYGIAAAGPCTLLTNLTTTAGTSLTGATAATISLPGAGGSRWAPAELHTFTFNVEVCGQGVTACTSPAANAPAGKQATFDVVWLALQ